MTARAGAVPGRRELERALARTEAGGAASRRVALEEVTGLLFRLDPSDVAPALVARAAAAGAPRDALEAGTSRPPHAVLAPLVVQGKGAAFVRTFYVSLDPGGASHDAPRLELDAEASIEAALVEARRLAASPPSGRFRLVAARPASLLNASVRGASLSAAALVSAYALWAGRSALPDVVVTGRVEGSRVVSVGAIAPKVRAARAAHAHAIVVPARDRDEAVRAARGALVVHAVSTTASLLSHALSTSGSPADLDDLVERALAAARHGWRGYRWAEARELLERALALVPEGALDRRVDLYARYGAAERHLGALERSARILREAEAILERPAARRIVPHDARSRAYQQLAMTDLRLARFTSATACARRAVRAAVRAASGRETVKALGCAGLVARARGRNLEAVRAFEAALELGLTVAPEDAARSRAYLVEALAATGDLGRAEREHRLALAEAMREGSPSKEAWVRTAWGGALVAAGRPEAAERVLDVPAVRDAIARTPLPGLVARRHLGRALLGRRRTQERALELLLTATEHAEVLEPGALFLADLNAWIAIAARARHGGALPAHRERLERSLDRLPREGELARFLGPAARRVRAALARPDPGALASALDALVASAERLA